jgi:small subunit ribosomal protein S18
MSETTNENVPTAAPVASAAPAPASSAPTSSSAPAGSHGPSSHSSGPRGAGAPRGRREGGFRFRRPHRKVCRFCADKVDFIDYKDSPRLRSFISERGKILPSRMTGTCARHQRELTHALKRARNIALLPFANA